MIRMMPFATVALVGIVAWGLGGYAPWAMLVLQVTSVSLAGWLVFTVVFGTSPATRKQNAATARSSRRARGWLGFAKGGSAVEILPPARLSDGNVERPSSSGPDKDDRTGLFFVCGYPFRRTGVGWMALAMTTWMALSLVPLRASWLRLVSPIAASFRNEVATLTGGGPLTSAPWSVTPFLSYQDLLLWIAYLSLFWVSYHIAASSRAARRLTMGLFALGVASGVYGLVQWLMIVGASEGQGPPAGGFMATGSFGNRNHYAFFQEMVLLVSLGWVSRSWSRTDPRTRGTMARQEARARSALLLVAVGCIALSLLFSLSRSGITFAAAGGTALVLMSRTTARTTPSKKIVPAMAALGLCFVATAWWIGIEPVISRFELVPQELRVDTDSRATVWRDSLAAVEDFWMTGSGLSSFQYVYPIYRSFGGRRFYSWAHNDYLQLTIELGLPGLLLTGFIIVWIIRRAAGIRAQLVERTGWRYVHAGYCAAALAVGLHSFTDFGLHLPANAALLAVVIGVVTGLSPDRESHRPRKIRRQKLRRSPPPSTT